MDEQKRAAEWKSAPTLWLATGIMGAWQYLPFEIAHK